VTGDASDSATVTRHATGTDAVFNCANPPYHRWPTDWPHRQRVARGRGNQWLETRHLNNLYAYGRPTGPMTPHDPLSADYEKAQVRATMWLDAKRAHDDGRIRATEVRASDFIGPRSESYLGLFIPRIIANKSCQVIGNIDAPHSWNYTKDVAHTLVTCAQDERSWVAPGTHRPIPRVPCARPLTTSHVS